MTDDIKTKEEAVDFVKQIFKQMGGKVTPPKRPGHRDKYEIITPGRDSFMMDFENHCLEHNWHWSINSWVWPQGNKRHEDPQWAAMIQSQVFPHHSDVDWEEYVEWVSRGFGDVYFQEEDDETPPPSPICGKIDYIICMKHRSGPLDVWYDCDECLQECDTLPTDGRYKHICNT